MFKVLFMLAPMWLTANYLLHIFVIKILTVHHQVLLVLTNMLHSTYGLLIFDALLTAGHILQAVNLGGNWAQ